MKFSTATIVLAAALGVSAHPSGHHAHKHAHRSIEAREEFVIAKKPSPTYAAPSPPPTSAAPPPPPPSSAPPAPKPAPTSSSPGGSGGSDPLISFCNGNDHAKRATTGEIAYKGNVGSPGNYGCNQMIVSEGSASHYQYTITFENKAGTDQAGVCWNKIGPTGGINGFFKGNEAVSFTVPAGGKKVLAVDTNSQGGCTFGSGTVPLTSFGQYAGTWVEFDFGNLSNGGWSGADASCLVSAANHLTIPALSVCGSGKCSTVNSGGTGENAYLGGMEALDGVGLNLAPGKTALTVTIG